MNDPSIDQLKFINADPAKLKNMRSYCWCPLEEPIVATPIEFNKKNKKGFRTGFLMFTRGAIYLFKQKMLHKDLKPPVMHHLLDVRVMTVLPNEILLEMDDFKLHIKTDHPVQVAAPMIYTLYSSTYGLPTLKVMDIKEQGVSLPTIRLTKRPNDALQWRALFLAHFYGIKGQQLYTMDYFEKFEAKKNSMIVIGPSLHPGNFAAAYGHAIAWESIIQLVYFQSFAPTKFAMFFNSLVDNALNIKRMVFSDYHNPKRLPEFSGAKIAHSSLVTYNFYRVLFPVIYEFVDKEKFLPQIEKLSIHKINQLDPANFTKLIDTMEANPCLQQTLRYFELARIQLPSYPMDHFTPMFDVFEKLECVNFSYVNIPVDQLLQVISTSKTRIHVIHMTYMQCSNSFTERPDPVILPPYLIHLDLSFCTFSDTAIVSLFKLISMTQFDNPIMLQLIKLDVNPNFIYQLDSIDLARVNPNSILEFDFSANKILAEPSLKLFAYLFTQKALRLVQFNSIEVDDGVTFLKNLMTLITNMQLPGFEVSGNFNAVTFNQFLTALAGMNLQYLRHVGFRHANTGSQGLGALNQLIIALPNLVELVAEGFFPELPALGAFWATVAKHPSIKATDLPGEDFKNLGLTLTELPSNLKETFRIIRDSKARAATISKKDEIYLRCFREGKPLDVSANFFAELAKDNSTYDQDNDFALVELDTAKMRTAYEKELNEQPPANHPDDDQD